MYAYYILHKLRRFPWEWIDQPYYNQAALFALVDEKIRQDKIQERKMKMQQNKAAKGGKRVGVRRKRR